MLKQQAQKTEGEQRRRQEGREMWIKARRRRESERGGQESRRKERMRGNRERDFKVMRKEEI